MSRVRLLLATIAVTAIASATSLSARALAADARVLTAVALADSIPVPAPGPLPFVREVRIHTAADPTRPVCSGDSVGVDVFGVFPTPCFELKRIDLIPPPYGSPLPAPPIVRLIVDDHACELHLCPEVLQPWQASVTLPPLPQGIFALRLEVARVTCADSLPPDSLPFFGHFPFSVLRCETPSECLTQSWFRSGGLCDARVSKNMPAQLTFNVSPSVALAGLQGEFRLSTEALQIATIEPVGPASDMHLEWNQTPHGARFLLFSPNGAPIPPAFPDSADSLPRPRQWAVLRVTVQLAGVRIPLPAVNRIQAYDVLGADIDGHAVPECPSIALWEYPPPAIICSAPTCDFNHDGRADIRDLVLMAHCVASRRDTLGGHAPPPCIDSVGVPDCNGDGHRTIADVVCCALGILRDIACPECPDDSLGAVRDPSVRVTMGTPLVEGGVARIPVTVENADRLGGALVALRYPSARYTASLELPEAHDWLDLQDVGAGVATVGLVRLDQDPTRHQPRARSFELRLTLRPGEHHGGDVAVSDVQFSSPEGASLEGGPIPSATPVAGHSLVELSQARPNPFSGETRFTVKVVERGDASVGVFDLAGRRVAQLHRGVLEAGTHEFIWRGTFDDGSPAPGGVYFYRATLAGDTAARRLVRLEN